MIHEQFDGRGKRLRRPQWSPEAYPGAMMPFSETMPVIVGRIDAD